MSVNVNRTKTEDTAARQEKRLAGLRGFAPCQVKSGSSWKGKISDFFKNKIVIPSLCSREAMAQFKYESNQSGVGNSRMGVICSY